MFNLFGGDADLGAAIRQVIAALLTIAASNYGLEKTWDTYQSFLERQGEYLIKDEDFKMAVEKIKETYRN